MMNGMGGLIEIVLVLSIVLAWGFIELRSNRRYRQQKKDEAAAGPQEPPGVIPGRAKARARDP